MTFCLTQKVEKSSDGHTEIVKNPWKSPSEQSKRHPGVPPVYPSCNMMHPRRVQGPPFPDFCMKLMPFGGAHGPHPVPGRSQKYPKNMTKVDPETDSEKVLQKVCKSIRKCIQIYKMCIIFIKIYIKCMKYLRCIRKHVK